MVVACRGIMTPWQATATPGGRGKGRSRERGTDHATLFLPCGVVFQPRVRQVGRAGRGARVIVTDNQVDTLVGSGLSGTLVVPSLARACDVPFWAIVRKEKTTHTSRLVEGAIGDRWLFVDD